ncbi:E3 ubiquitin-protein ligase PUB23-like [Fagus crenata]
MEEIDVPPFFICPISLEIMKDPVIVPTGITYDRESIERWLFSGKNKTCPVTKQALAADCDLTPNHTLRRLLQSWCTMNASHGVERIPTPKPPMNKTQIAKLLKDAKTPQLKLKCLHKLRLIASESETNKRCMEAAGAVEFLASIVMSNTLEEASDIDGVEVTIATGEALGILHNLQVSEAGLKSLIGKNGEFIETLVSVMQSGHYESRAYAVLLLKSMVEVADPMSMISLRTEFFIELVQVLRDQISQQASKAILQLLVQLCPWGRNRVKAVEAGAVSVLIDLLLDTSERRRCEMMLVVLDMLCGSCAEARAELLKHGAGLAIVSKKILRVSQVATDRAVRILFSISKFSATPNVLHEMLQIGVVAKLCLTLNVDSGEKTREKAKEILRLHARAWKSCSCLPNNLL